MPESLEEIFPEIYKLRVDGNTLLVTRNMTPRRTYYGEPTYQVDAVEYRSWNPTRSKLAAAIMKGIGYMPVRPGATVLYLGAASGTTVSHVSDILGETGHVWGLDFAPRALRDLIDKVARYRSNVSPILSDANKPMEYSITPCNCYRQSRLSLTWSSLRAVGHTCRKLGQDSLLDPLPDLHRYQHTGTH